jgi:hypothetical protein
MTVGDLAPLRINDLFFSAKNRLNGTEPKAKNRPMIDKSGCQKTLVNFIGKNRLKVTQIMDQ